MNSDGSCNIAIVRDTLELISKSCNGIIVIINQLYHQEQLNLNKLFSNIQIVFNPEFLTERNSVSDYENQERIILGGPRPATTVLKQLFSRVFKCTYNKNRLNSCRIYKIFYELLSCYKSLILMKCMNWQSHIN